MKPAQTISAAVETQVLDETESALGEFIQVSINVGLSKAQMAMMLRRKADELSPMLIIPSTEIHH